jgi:hypothetical protein
MQTLPLALSTTPANPTATVDGTVIKIKRLQVCGEHRRGHY